MTTTLTADQNRSERLSTKNRIGLVLCGVLGLGDVAGLFAIGQQDPGEAGPPAAVLVAAGILGIITLVAVVSVWRTRSRRATRVVAGARILSALTAVPAFFVDDVGNGLIALAGTGIVITLVAIWLLMSRPGPV